jgi:lysophospholipase L1-like esterase
MFRERLQLVIGLATIALTCSSIWAQTEPVKIFLAGDSTCSAKAADKRPETGWGEMLQKHFDLKKVVVDNRAANGRSTRSFLVEKLWDELVEKITKGDHVFIQFGHNDASRDKGERYAPPEEYRANLRRFVQDVRAKGGVPVLFTPVVRRRFDSAGKFYDTHGEYPDIVRSVAADMHVTIIDMHAESRKLIEKLGVEASKELFLQLRPGESVNYPKGIEDNTHFSPIGADMMATLVVEKIRLHIPKLRKSLMRTGTNLKI